MADEDSGPGGSNRRGFLAAASTAAMSAGLVGGYGAFALIAGRFLYPAKEADRSWQFVVEEEQVAVGKSLLYRTPSGQTVNITRKERNGDAADFIALSSTCPHLGCQVHWEATNNRYFCPCHNGTFDPDGIGTSGPPGDAGQTLPRYNLLVDGGMLFIEVETDQLVSTDRKGEVVASSEAVSGPGHDPCLAPGAGKPGTGNRPA